MHLSIHPEGWRFVTIFFAISLVLFWVSPGLGWIGLLLTVWCGYFFRNPPRVTPDQKGCIISPADGLVVDIQDVIPPKDYGMGQAPLTRISVFLSVFDVHLNRIPLGGTVVKRLYNKGKFFNASLDKASEHNERLTLIIQHDHIKYAVVQIAGLIARRIRCDAYEGDSVLTGNIYGLIRFGSRVDIWLPEKTRVHVLKGQRMVAGETILATLP